MHPIRRSWPRLLWAGALALPLLATACGDSTGPDERGLSEADARALALAMAGGASAPAPTLLLPLSGGPAGSHTIPCPAGGSITLERSGSHELDGSGTGSITFTLTQVQRACVVPVRGQKFVIDGDPGMTITGTMKLASRLPVESTMRESGGFRWTIGERSGSCRTDVTRTMTFSPTPSGSVQGTVCGVAVSHTMSW